jgi:hypothetical protein
VLGIFKIGSLKLFAQNGFELPSSDLCLLIAAIAGMSHPLLSQWQFLFVFSNAAIF